MKMIKYMLTALCGVLLMVSCYDDKGNYNYKDLSDITITGFADEGYYILAGIDNLKITPDIETTYDESKFTYTWTLWNEKNEIDTLYHGPEFRNIDEPIGGLGKYTLYYYVKNEENGYYNFAKTTLTVATEYSQGFYILKETAGGDTDLDLLLMDGRVVEDIITLESGQPLAGAPRSLGVMYSRPMVDPDNDSKSYDNCLGIITEDDNVNIFRTKDMYLAFDQANMYYERPAAEVPYRFITGYNCEYYSSNGIYRLDLSSPGSGYLGIPNGEAGGGVNMAWSANMTGVVMWDEDAHKIFYADGAIHEIDEDASYPLADYDYKYIGCNNDMDRYASTAYCILKSKSDGALIIYEIDAGYGSCYVLSVMEVDPGSKLNDATNFAIYEYGETPYLYFSTSDNKLHYVNLADASLTVSDLPVQISDGGTITYLSNQYFDTTGSWGSGISTVFNHLAVATVKDGGYNLYMYNFTGALPDGNPILTASGTGRLKHVSFLGALSSVSEFDTMGEAWGNNFRWTR